jgi:glyoxylase-like metal-dependent hydrolase (beta-lactamase superfamily II)
MTRRLLTLLVFATPLLAEFHAVKDLPELFVWQGTCNTYLLRSGSEALVIDPGDAEYAAADLAALGVTKVGQLLLTDHHRELLQGWSHVKAESVAAPKAEQDLLSDPLSFRKWHPSLKDRYTVHGSSYVRPPAAPVAVSRWLEDGEMLQWKEHSFLCRNTPGHSPGGMSYELTLGRKRCVFSGGVMHDGARFTRWFDTEWDYGFAKGLDALLASVQSLVEAGPEVLLPSQGSVVWEAAAQLSRYKQRLTEFRAAYVRGYPVDDLTKRGAHPATRPTAVQDVVKVTPHLYMFGPAMAGKNFAIIIADSGHALLLDCGLFTKLQLNKMISDMKQHLGLKQIDACWISHMHGDHFTLVPALREHGVKLWTMDSIADKCEHPLRYDFPALIPAYGAGFDGTSIDRVLKPGEVVEWEGMRLHIDWMPGQTEFGNCLWLELDGKKIAFTGDNLFGDPSDATQDGHECVVARNSAILEEGYLVAARYLKQLQPDIIMGAHSVLMTEPAAFVGRYEAWALRMIQLYRDMLPDKDYLYLYDPYWVSAYPYRLDLREQQTVDVTIRNFRDTPQRHRVKLCLPPGLTAEPAILEGQVSARSKQTFSVKLSSTSGRNPRPEMHMIPLDITLDGKRYGQWFDFLVRE